MVCLCLPVKVAAASSKSSFVPSGRLSPQPTSACPPEGAAGFTNKTGSGFNLVAFSAVFPAAAGRALRRAVAAAASGELQVRVESLRLEQAAQAHRRIESGRTTGKLVLEVERI
jgi:NADPH:quinone reductase-like Zn-dependent oxidoreductase